MLIEDVQNRVTTTTIIITIIILSATTRRKELQTSQTHSEKLCTIKTEIMASTVQTTPDPPKSSPDTQISGARCCEGRFLYLLHASENPFFTLKLQSGPKFVDGLGL